MDLRAAGTRLGDFHGTLTGKGDLLQVEGEGQGEGGSLHLHLRTTAKDDWSTEAEGEFSGLRADPWIRSLFNHSFDAALTLGGTFHAHGSLLAPEKMDLRSSLRDVALAFPSIQWHNDQPVDAQYSGGRLALSRFTLRGPSTELGIEGAVLLNNGPSLNLAVDGAANATLLTMFDSNLQASGRSTWHVRVAGSPARPRLNGAIDIQDVSLDYRGLPTRFNNLQGTIDLQGERAVIRSLRGTSGSGTVSFGGSITLAENPHADLTADFTQVRVRYPTGFTSVLDGHLRLTGGEEQGQVSGDLLVRQMIPNENVNFVAKLFESANPVPESPVSVASPLASRIRMNVRVTSSPPVQLQVPSMRLVGDIDVRLQGTVANTVQVGSIHLLRGESVFRGNRYTLVRGDLSMTNPFHTEVYLDLEAQTHVQNYDLTLDVSGPFDRLKFSYRSDPPLATSDILSLLALGYVKQEQAFSTVGGNPAASIGASAILSEALSSQTTSRIQRLFGVSRIKIDPNVAVPGFGSGARVTVEQQVSHDLTLTYVTDTSYSQYRIIQFEWNVSDNVSLLGVRDQNGVFGVELRFRRRFK
jgi:translocation and assembly module TamB